MSRLQWEGKGRFHTGRLPSKQPTSLFFIRVQPGRKYALSGAFIPDGLDGKAYDTLPEAKAAAEEWTEEWVATHTAGWKESRAQ